MHISMIVGSAEPGKDGVGDYSRQLAQTLNSMDFDVQLIAAYDKHTDGS